MAWQNKHQATQILRGDRWENVTQYFSTQYLAKYEENMLLHTPTLYFRICDSLQLVSWIFCKRWDKLILLFTCVSAKSFPFWVSSLVRGFLLDWEKEFQGPRSQVPGEKMQSMGWIIRKRWGDCNNNFLNIRQNLDLYRQDTRGLMERQSTTWRK